MGDDTRREFFPITSVSRDDIVQAFEETDMQEQVKQRVEKLDDSEMEYLASKMADDYCEQLFWDSLRTIFELRFLEEAAGVNIKPV